MPEQLFRTPAVRINEQNISFHKCLIPEIHKELPDAANSNYSRRCNTSMSVNEDGSCPLAGSIKTCQRTPVCGIAALPHVAGATT